MNIKTPKLNPDQKFVEMAKALHDELKSKIDKSLKEMRSEVALLAVKDISWEVDKKLKELEQNVLKSVEVMLTKAFSDSEGGMLLKLGNIIEKSIEQKTKSISDLELKLLETEQNLTKSVDLVHSDCLAELSDAKFVCLEQIKDLEDKQSLNFNTVVDLVKSLPTPQVVLPESAIQIKLLPSVVQVTEKAFNLHVDSPKVDVHVPEQKSIVNVQVKDLPAPIVNVQQPPARLLVKKFKYNEYGQPEEVREEEIKDEENAT